MIIAKQRREGERVLISGREPTAASQVSPRCDARRLIFIGMREVAFETRPAGGFAAESADFPVSRVSSINFKAAPQHATLQHFYQRVTQHLARPRCSLFPWDTWRASGLSPHSCDTRSTYYRAKNIDLAAKQLSNSCESRGVHYVISYSFLSFLWRSFSFLSAFVLRSTESDRWRATCESMGTRGTVNDSRLSSIR